VLVEEAKLLSLSRLRQAALALLFPIASAILPYQTAEAQIITYPYPQVVSVGCPTTATAGQPLTCAPTIIPGTNNGAPVLLNWTASANVGNSATPASEAAATFTTTVAQPGAVNVVLAVYQGLYSVYPAPVTITVNAAPMPVITGLGCPVIEPTGQVFTCHAATTGTVTSWHWTASSGASATGASAFTTSFGSAGTGSITLTACDYTSCASSSASMNVFTSSSQTNSMHGNVALAVNHKLVSSSGAYELILGDDGNLVLYAPGGKALWSSHTQGHPDVSLVLMQGDGNMVEYSASGSPLWASGTQGHSGAWLAIQNDGNLVVYSSQGAPLWASDTVQ
jgi:hypothetical protein